MSKCISWLQMKDGLMDVFSKMRIILTAFLLTIFVSTVQAADILPSDIYLAQNIYADKTSFKPRSDLPKWTYSLPIKWDANPFKDNNWQFQLHAWRIMDPFLVRYFETGSADDLNYAVALAVDWYRWHLTDQARYSWYDMAAGIRAMRIALFLSLLDKGVVDDSNAPALLSLAREHANKLQVDKYISSGNHGLFQIFGLHLLCFVAEIEECADATRFSTDKFRWILGHQFTEEGVHKENSPTYHGFVRAVIRRLGGAERFNMPEVDDLLQKAALVQPWLIFPDGRWARIGDSEGKVRSSQSLRGGAKGCLESGECFAISAFNQSGYAVIRSLPPSTRSMLFVTGMAHTVAHKHADELSFELFEHGRFIFIDSGKYGYANDDMREHVRSTDAHNTIGLADRQISPDEIEFTGGLLRQTEVGADGISITGSVDRPSLFKQHRRITYTPGIRLVIQDSVSSDTDRLYVSSLHLASDLKPEPTLGGFRVNASGHTITARLADDDCEIEIVRGVREPSVLGWETVGYLNMVPASVVRAICNGTTRTIRWDISLS